MRVLAKLLRHELEELLLDFLGRFSRGEARAIGDAEDVRVDRNCRLSECDVEDDVGGLAADARQSFERGAVGGNTAAVFRQQDLRQSDDVLRLVAKSPIDCT